MSDYRVPKGLSLPSRRWFKEVVETYELESHHLRILETAARSWDRMEEARALIDKHGMLIADRFGQLRSNPATAIERDCKLAFLRSLRELALDVEPPVSHGIPRLLGGRR